jgi:hypothetical protein
LGADNQYWTADYPGVTRTAMEEAEPGSVCLFLTGCCGELNTGHSAASSVSLGAAAGRTFAEAGRIGHRLAAAAAAIPVRAPARPAASDAATAEITLPLQASDPARTAALAAQWERELPEADPARQALLCNWLAWADDAALRPVTWWTARVSVLSWPGARVVTLPGEPFSVTARDIASQIAGTCLVTGYTDGCPGYLPPREEFGYGGYEVEDAHRYYGMPAPFAPGAAEALAKAAVTLAGHVERPASGGPCGSGARRHR